MTTQPAEALDVVDLGVSRADARHALDQAAAALVLVDALVDTHQRGLGFLTHEGRLALDELVRAERRDLAASPDPGLNTGNVPPPVNLRALEAEANLWATLAHQARRLRRLLVARGVCPIRQLLDPTNVTEIVEHLRNAIDLLDDPDVLGECEADLQAAAELAGRVIDGHDRILLEADCPHCSHRTLVVDIAAGTIRCERDPKTGRFSRCTCSDPLCACKVNPFTFRHTWHRTKGNARDGWLTLAGRLNLRRVRTRTRSKGLDR